MPLGRRAVLGEFAYLAGGVGDGPVVGFGVGPVLAEFLGAAAQTQDQEG